MANYKFVDDEEHFLYGLYLELFIVGHFLQTNTV